MAFAFLSGSYTLEELSRLISKKYGLNYQPKQLLKILEDAHISSSYIYLSGGINSDYLIIGKHQCKAASYEFKDYLVPYGKPSTEDYAGSLQELKDYFIKTGKNTLKLSEQDFTMEMFYDVKKDTITPEHFEGLFFIPPKSFNELNFLLSDDDSIYLPNYARYDSASLIDNPARERASYNFSFLYIIFDEIRGRGIVKIADIWLDVDFNALDEYFKKRAFKTTTTETTEETPKTEKTVKNKSNKRAQNPTDKRKVIEPAVLESIKRTAEANPHLGGYQIINAVIAAMKIEQRYIETDFFTPEAYLKKVKSRYGITFPRNSGRKKAEVKVILA